MQTKIINKKRNQIWWQCRCHQSQKTNIVDLRKLIYVCLQDHLWTVLFFFLIWSKYYKNKSQKTSRSSILQNTTYTWPTITYIRTYYNVEKKTETIIKQKNRDNQFHVHIYYLRSFVVLCMPCWNIPWNMWVSKPGQETYYP